MTWRPPFLPRDGRQLNLGGLSARPGLGGERMAESIAIPSGFREALDFAAAQADRILTMYPDYSPMYTVGGRWNREGERWTHWCEGFFPGILWLLYRHTKDEKWSAAARKLSRALEPRKFDRNVHDLGFLFFSTYLREYNLFGDAHCRDVLLQAG